MTSNSHAVDCITELVNIGAGKAASSMNQLLGSHVTLTIPWVDFETDLQEDIYQNMTGIQMRFSGSPEGYAQLLFKKNDVPVVIQGLLGFDADDETDESLKGSALTELGNIVINAIVGSICNMTSSQVVYDVPVIVNYDSCNSAHDCAGKTIIRAGTKFSFEKLNVSAVLFLFISESSFLGRLQI